jgi:hypothetical protein
MAEPLIDCVAEAAGIAAAGWIISGSETSGAATLANSLNFFDIDKFLFTGVVPRCAPFVGLMSRTCAAKECAPVRFVPGQASPPG